MAAEAQNPNIKGCYKEAVTEETDTQTDNQRQTDSDVGKGSLEAMGTQIKRDSSYSEEK